MSKIQWTNYRNRLEIDKVGSILQVLMNFDDVQINALAAHR